MQPDSSGYAIRIRKDIRAYAKKPALNGVGFFYASVFCNMRVLTKKQGQPCLAPGGLFQTLLIVTLAPQTLNSRLQSSKGQVALVSLRRVL